MIDAATGGGFATLPELRAYLRECSAQEASSHFGIVDPAILDQVVGNWFEDERNYDGRWGMLANQGLDRGRILDMAAGCGTFVLHGLRQGRDVVGVEPEPWKRRYFAEKVRLSGLPGDWAGRMVDAVGERLPFPDETFDLVTSYQTLEHVADVRASLEEMLRVLKPGGVLYLRAPDYASFFEPHYRLPFLPCMDKRLARAYLRWCGRPLLGLETLHWTTTRGVLRLLAGSAYRTSWRSGVSLELQRHYEGLRWPLAPLWRHRAGRMLFFAAAHAWLGLKDLAGIGRRERHINLWIRREPA